jgi:hypothetical protein
MRVCSLLLFEGGLLIAGIYNELNQMRAAKPSLPKNKERTNPSNILGPQGHRRAITDVRLSHCRLSSNIANESDQVAPT